MAANSPGGDTSRTFPIKEDMAFQRRSWIAERVAWIAISIGLVAALLGLFSRGTLSSATASAQDAHASLTVEYQRFERSDAATQVTLRVQPRQAGDSIAITFSSGFTEAFEIATVRPEPIASRGGGRGLTQVFALAGGELTIRIDGRARGAGVARSVIAVENGPSITLTQLIYP